MSADVRTGTSQAPVQIATTFARLTGDEQWIHVDPERAASGLVFRYYG